MPVSTRWSHHPGKRHNTAVMVAVESLPSRRLGRVRLELAETARSSDLVSFATRVIEEGSTIKTDGAANLKRLSGLGYQHERFVGLDSKEPAHVNLPGVHVVASLLKRWLTGTLHYAVSQERWGATWTPVRFMRRGPLFYRLLQRAVNADRRQFAGLRKSRLRG